MRRMVWVAAWGAALLLARPAGAQFYAGDPNGVYGLSCERNTLVSDARVYEQLVVPVTFVSSQMVGCFARSPAAGNVSQVYWEVRTGMAVGNPGTLIATGVTPAATTHFGWMFGSYPMQPLLGGGMMPSVQIVQISTPLALALAPGSYQITMSPIGIGQGRYYSCSTSGLNAIGGSVNDGVAYMESPFWGYPVIDSQTVFGTGVDFSLGLL